MSDIEYDPSSNSYSSLHIEVDTLNLSFFYIFPCMVYAKI